MVLRAASIVVAVSILASGAFAQPRTEPNSFLTKNVRTPADLIQQTRTDPHVRDRYMRHYAMTSDELVAYFSTFRRDTLPAPATFTIYSIPEGGYVKAHSETLKKGEPVFVDQSGDPVMRIKCGNPLALGPKRPFSENAIIPVEAPREELALRSLEAPAEEALLLAEAPLFEPAVPTITAPPVAPPVETTGTAPGPIVTPSGGFPVGLLPLGILPFISPGGGAPIPEPGTMLALGGGFAAMLARRRRRK